VADLAAGGRVVVAGLAVEEDLAGLEVEAAAAAARAEVGKMKIIDYFLPIKASRSK
jgi:hypothetical protein